MERRSTRRAGSSIPRLRSLSRGEGMRMGRSLKITRLGEGIVSLQIATDETPDVGDWYVPVLSEAVERLKADERIRVVLVEGGDRYFSAGASREALLSSEPEAMIQSYVGELPR